MLDICELIETSNRTLLPSDGLHRGYGFPTGCSLNHVAAHYTPNYGDQTVKLGSILWHIFHENWKLNILREIFFFIILSWSCPPSSGFATRGCAQDRFWNSYKWSYYWLCIYTCFWTTIWWSLYEFNSIVCIYIICEYAHLFQMFCFI